MRTQRRDSNPPPRSTSLISRPGTEGPPRSRTSLPAEQEERQPGSTIPARLRARLVTPAGRDRPRPGRGEPFSGRAGRRGRTPAAAPAERREGSGGGRGRVVMRWGRWCRRPALGSSRSREGAPSSACCCCCCSAPAVGACRAAGPRGRPWCWVRAGRVAARGGRGAEPSRARVYAAGHGGLGKRRPPRSRGAPLRGSVGSGGCVLPRSLRAAGNNALGSERCAGNECYRPVLPGTRGSSQQICRTCLSDRSYGVKCQLLSASIDKLINKS